MEYLVITLMFLAAIHFVYEAIILPNLRLEIRFKLFEQRDKLRTLKDKFGTELDERIFNSLDNSINNSINSLPFLSWSLLRKSSREIEGNKKLKAKIRQKIELIENCNIDEIQKIHSEVTTLCFKGFVFNSGGWIPYLLIPYLLYKVLIKPFKALFMFCRTNIKYFTFTSDSWISKFDESKISYALTNQ